MKTQFEPMQQPIRKVVGRPLTASQRLAILEDLANFVERHSHGSFTRTDGDYFPVRKTVGQARLRRD
jgi:hypothetical protein